MRIELSVPEELAEALRAEGRSVESEVGVVLAISCYEQGLISVGRAAEISCLKRGEFEEELARRKVARPYLGTDVKADSDWARSFRATVEQP